jgi:hypothetical protein
MGILPLYLGYQCPLSRLKTDLGSRFADCPLVMLWTAAGAKMRSDAFAR